MARNAHPRGQAVIELLITASTLFLFLYLIFEVSEIATKEQKRFQFSSKSQIRRSR